MQQVKKILVVDDTEQVRHFLVDYLSVKYPEAEIFEAENAQRGLLIVEAENPDLVVSDIRMPPGKDGLWLTQQIKAKYPLTKVILASGDTSRAEAMASGADGFFPKPVRIAALQKELNAVLAG